MPEEHLHPNRGWTLIRDGGQFSSAEVAHLKNCQKCSEWLSLFANLARNSGFKPEFDAPFFVMVDEHITPERGWGLIRKKEDLTAAEFGHLTQCNICNQWLASFARIAQSAGFSVTFKVPPFEGEDARPQQ